MSFPKLSLHLELLLRLDQESVSKLRHVTLKFALHGEGRYFDINLCFCNDIEISDA